MGWEEKICQDLDLDLEDLEVADMDLEELICQNMEVADMGWEEQICHDLDTRSFFSSQVNQSRNLFSQGQNELQPEQEQSGVEKEREENLRTIRDIVASGRAAVKSSSAASSAAQEASKAAATAARNAKAALEEMEQLVSMLEDGHKHHQRRSLSSGVEAAKISSDGYINDPRHFDGNVKSKDEAALEEIEQLVNMLEEGHKYHQRRSFSSGVQAVEISSDEHINDPPHFHYSVKTSVEQSKDETAWDASSEQNTKEGGEKEKESVNEKVTQIFSRKGAILDGIEDNSTLKSQPFTRQELEGFDAVNAETNIQVSHSRVLPEAASTIEEEDPSLKSMKDAEESQKAYMACNYPCSVCDIRSKEDESETVFTATHDLHSSMKKGAGEDD